MRVIAFTGPKGCGKDTAALGLLKLVDPKKGMFPFRKSMFAEGVKNFCQDFFGWTFSEMDSFDFKETPRQLFEEGPIMEPRWPMMDVANWLRDKYGAEIHARRWELHAKRWENNSRGAHVVPDLRFPNEELPAIRRYDSLVIYIYREEAEARLAEAQAKAEAMAMNPSEAHYPILLKAADLVIRNDDSVESLQAQVQSAVRNKFGFWGYWGGA